MTKAIVSTTVRGAAILLLTGAAFAQDAAKGKAVFNQCMACHALDHAVIGPQLGGVIGRKAASIDGFGYSPLLKEAGDAGLVWNEQTLTDYLVNPTQYLQDYVKSKGKDPTGTSRMIYMLASEDHRKNVVAYIASTKDK